MNYVLKNQQASTGFKLHFANFLGADDISSYRFVNLLALLAAVFALYHMALLFTIRLLLLPPPHYFLVGFLCLARRILLRQIRY